MKTLACLSIVLFGLIPLALAVDEPMPEKVSYYHHVRPVFQAKCVGCHQPAKNKADYIMTDVANLIKGGESGAALMASKPEESHLIELITTQPGEKRPAMPPKDEPLTDFERALVTKWISEGALDDTPENARQRFTTANPPIYSAPPVITSLDYSPDGQLLAISGFHEVLLHKVDGSAPVARLVGLSERIERVKFSPDGKWLAVAGGLPGRMGEIQVWDVAKRELKLSRPVGFDTAYGASWSPDSKLIAFGLPDNTVRAINADNGEQVLFMGSHNDWVLDTDWGSDGEFLVSVGRDMTTKLTEVKTERFVDNLTSITPGALNGGINTIQRHPKQDHVLVGSSGGEPQIYRMKRETARKIGDNANLIRKYPPMKGRIWDAAFRPDGKQFAAVSSLDGSGQINIYKSEYDATITPELKKLFEQARNSANEAANQSKEIEEFQTRGAELIKSIDINEAIFSVAYSPDGKTLAAGSEDGKVRLLNSADLAEKRVFSPFEVSDTKLTRKEGDSTNLKKGKPHDFSKETLPLGRSVVAISASPEKIDLKTPGSYAQLVVTATLNTGETADITRKVSWSQDGDQVLEMSPTGIARPLKEGSTKLKVSFENSPTMEVGVSIAGLNADFHPDFIRDVNPVISRLGCNMGTCHGAKDGKNGFKLSLRGYDPLFDVRAFGDDHAARRVNYSSPDDSLMLLKATGAVPHEGGMLTGIGSDYYAVIRRWIAEGAQLNTGAPKVTRIEVLPRDPVVQNIGALQQLRVMAYWADGSSRDVTLEAFIESGNIEVARHDDFGLMETIRRGEAPILARYEGAYAATTLTVMGDRDGFTWEEPESWGKIDQLVAAKLQRMKIKPSGTCNDAEFIRRIHLDLTGLPPSADQTRAFIADARPMREKRDAVIDELIGSPAFVDYWANKWSDLLQVNSKFLGGEGARLFRDWIRAEVEKNTPYDEFVYKILTATGSNKENPAASYFKILRQPDEIMENTTHLFLATRFNCNKCHDHPFERWTQDQYYETAGFFAQVGLSRDAKNAPNQNISGSAVEEAKPLYELVSDRLEGEMIHDRTKVIQPPAFPYVTPLAKVAFQDPTKPTRREQLGAWITSPENPYFASSFANRIWGYLLGTGIIEPLDDVRAGNPPSNPQLLDYLTQHFVGSGFNFRELTREICRSRTYQLSIATNEWNETDEINFSHAKARRLPAEVLYDAVHVATGTTPEIPGVSKGVRASQLYDAKIDLKSGFLANLGRPVRESACECERSNDLQMSAIMAFLSGPAIADAVGAADNDVVRLVRNLPDDRKVIEEIYYRVLSRGPSDKEVEAALQSFQQIQVDHAELVKRLSRAEAEWVPKQSELEVTRYENINRARAELDNYMPTHLANKQKAEADQRAKVAVAAKAIEERQTQLPKAVEEFVSQVKPSDLWTQWHLLPVLEVSASDKTKVEKLEDGSIRSQGGSANRNLDYIITADPGNKTITGIMIEAIAEETYPGQGPGLVSRDGNFVITEVQAKWHPTADPKKETALKFIDAKADFEQNGFSVKNLYNGNLDRSDKGWALSGADLKLPHRAMLKFDKPFVGDQAGSKLIVSILNRYSGGELPIGRFRLWYSTDVDPLAQGLPAPVAVAVSKSPAARSADQSKDLLNYVQENDKESIYRKFQHVLLQRPLPADEKLNQLQQAIKTAELPVVAPSDLQQLRQDMQHSNQQAANLRLTAAQDLTWALLNNPSFLFNR